MLKILESIRCCLWRGVNSCLTWLRTVRRDGSKCACLFFIHDMFGWKYTHLPSFLIYLPLTRNCILTTHFRDYDQICWWHGMGFLEELPQLVPEKGLSWKSLWKFGIALRLSSIVFRLGFSTCQCWQLAEWFVYFYFIGSDESFRCDSSSLLTGRLLISERKR